MRIECPKCRSEVPIENLSLDEGQAKCAGCHETFSLAEVVAGYPAQPKSPARLDRPADALARLNRTPDLLEIDQPAQGFRNLSCGKYLCWAIIPLAMKPFSIAFMLNFARHDPPGQAHWDLAFILFMPAVWYIPLCLFVCFMLGAVVWLSSSERSVCCDADRMDMELRCWRWRRRRSVARDDVQCARPRIVDAKKKESLDNMDYTHAVQLVYEGGSFNLPCKHAAEQAWLLDEINEFLMS